MKKTCRQILLAAALLAATCTFAAQPAEQVPRPQILQQQTDLLNDGAVIGGMMVAQEIQHQGVMQQQVASQRQSDPPVMIKIVRSLGATSARTPWLDAVASSKIPNLWDLATRDRQKVPDPSDVVTAKVIPDGDGISSEVADINPIYGTWPRVTGKMSPIPVKGDGSSLIDRMPCVALIT